MSLQGGAFGGSKAKTGALPATTKAKASGPTGAPSNGPSNGGETNIFVAVRCVNVFFAFSKKVSFLVLPIPIHGLIVVLFGCPMNRNVDIITLFPLKARSFKSWGANFFPLTNTIQNRVRPKTSAELSRAAGHTVELINDASTLIFDPADPTTVAVSISLL
jgi:hypothetical protein